MVGVYVDDARIPATVGRVVGRWSHLTADTRTELHAFAARIGLRREWFQDKPNGLWHYDVTETKRAAAVRAGAGEVSWRDRTVWMRPGREGRPAPDTTPAAPVEVDGGAGSTETGLELVVLVGGPLHGRWVLRYGLAGAAARRRVHGRTRPTRAAAAGLPAVPAHRPHDAAPGPAAVATRPGLGPDRAGVHCGRHRARGPAVTGRRGYWSPDPGPGRGRPLSARALDAERARIPEGGVLTVVHGACPRGADAAAAAWCAHAQDTPGSPVVAEAHPPRWRGPDGTVDRRAGVARNAAMIALGADLVLGFLLDGSPGTADCLRRAAAARIPALIHRAYSAAER